MTQPISGRDMMPKSLEVSRLEQLRSTAEHQQQQQLAIKQDKQREDKQRQVNKSNQSESNRVRSDQESGRKKRQFKQRKKPADDEKDTKEEETLLADRRGNIIDFRV